MTNLRALARDRDCQIRLPGICNGDAKTVVGCHYRLMGTSGLGYKSPDALLAWGCSECHRHVDTNHDDATQLAFAHGVFRTQAILIREGVLQW